MSGELILGKLRCGRPMGSRSKSFRQSLFLLGALLPIQLAGCTLGPSYTRPELPFPERFSEDAPSSGESIANLPWWEVFKESDLQQLIRTALAENRDLQVSLARIAEARARLGFVRADQFPRMDLSGNANRIDPSDAVESSLGTPYSDFGLFGDLSFEVDLWGKLRQATESQRMELLSTEYAYRTVTISLVAQVARTYFVLVDLDNRLQIAERTVTGRKNSTGLIAARFGRGIVPELDLNQAQTEEADALAQVAQIERDRLLAQNALNVLLGRTSGKISRQAGLVKVELVKDPAVGFPTALLERRPDVQAAEYTTRAAFARIGVAEAQRLPSLNLLGSIGLQSSDASEFFSDSFTWDVGGGLFGPVVDFGKNRSRVEITDAQAKQAVKSYEQTVLVAVGEVENALAAYRTYRAENESRKAQVKAATNAARLSRARYDEGVTAYLEVLDIERSLFAAELAESESYQNYLRSIVDLYQALGGGWSDT